MDSTLLIAEYKHYTLNNKGVPYCYTQQLLIQNSKYYKLKTKNALIIFRDAIEGYPNIFDTSIKNLFIPQNETRLIYVIDWVNLTGNYPYSVIKYQGSKIFKR